MRTVLATRYVTPLREGGSLPAIIEADDDGMYVLKLRGAGQAPRSLVAELIAGEIARVLELPVPEIVLVDVRADLGRNEPDYEIRSLLAASVGTNLGLDYLPGSLAWDPAASPPPDALFASRIVWLDAYVMNVDRTARNTNLLLWHGKPWLIDHGAALYFHHHGFPGDANATAARRENPFPLIAQHVLLPWAKRLRDADADAHAKLDVARLAAIVDLVPDDWLAGESSPAEQRDAYVDHLAGRLAASQSFVTRAEEEAQRVRAPRV